MKRILLVSDSHRRSENIRLALKKEPEPDLMIHLGDAERGYDEIRDMVNCPVWMVKGNMDSFSSGLSNFEIIEAEGHRIFAAHGHMFDVQYGIGDLMDAAKSLSCDIAVFGHTHVPYYAEIEGITLINPGSISIPRQRNGQKSFGILELSDDKSINCRQLYLGGV